MQRKILKRVVNTEKRVSPPGDQMDKKLMRKVFKLMGVLKR